MAEVTATITLPDRSRRAGGHRRQPWSRAVRTRLSTLARSVEGLETYTPQVEADMMDLMGDAAGKVHVAFTDAGFDVLISRAVNP